MSWPLVPFEVIIADCAYGPRFSSDSYDEFGNVATLRTTDLSPDGVISLDSMPLAKIDEDKFEGHFLKVGDLVISRSGRIGTTAVFNGYSKPVLPGAFLLRFRLDISKAHPLFYLTFFNSSEGQQLLQSVSQGAAQQNINITNVKKLKVPLPSPEEQHQIASVVAYYDDLIATNRRQVELLEQAARLIYTEWFVRLRFPGQKRKSPAWPAKALNNIADINTQSLGKQPPWETLLYVDISSVSPGLVEQKIEYSLPDAPGRAKRLVAHGDIIWSCVRPNRRSHALILNPEENLVVSTGFATIRPKSVPWTYLYLAVTTDAFVAYLESHAQGVAYPAVTGRDFEKAEILLPPPEILEQFDQLTKPIFEQIETLKSHIEKLRQARDLLLPRLISGQLRL